jgi:hypothetical protein
VVHRTTEPESRGAQQNRKATPRPPIPIIALAARHMMAASYSGRDFVVLGGLMSYGPNQADVYRRDLNLNQGFYLTPAPAELVNLLNSACLQATGHPLPTLRRWKRNRE